MRREFVPFEESTVDAEFEALRRASSSDAAKLEFVIERVEDTPLQQDPSPALIWTFSEGFKELRHRNGVYKGRLLYYEPPTDDEIQPCVILVVFRKQTQKTPAGVIAKAVRRMAYDMEKRKG